MDNARLQLAYRIARPRDAQWIADLSRAQIESGLPVWQWHARRVLQSLLDAETCAVVAVSQGQALGFAMMKFGERHAHLNLLAVRAEHHRRGIGRGMLAWLEESASVAGITEIWLEVRIDKPVAQRFYRALGYQVVKTIDNYYCGQVDALRMRRVIGLPI